MIRLGSERIHSLAAGKGQTEAFTKDTHGDEVYNSNGIWDDKR